MLCHFTHALHVMGADFFTQYFICQYFPNRQCSIITPVSRFCPHGNHRTSNDFLCYPVNGNLNQSAGITVVLSVNIGIIAWAEERVSYLTIYFFHFHRLHRMGMVAKNDICPKVQKVLLPSRLEAVWLVCKLRSPMR